VICVEGIKRTHHPGIDEIRVVGGGLGKHSFSQAGEGEGVGSGDHAHQARKLDLLTSLWTTAVVNLSYISVVRKCLI
jgi:hypothetical protein